jgi:hypothetical protein
VTYPMWFALSTCCAAATGRMSDDILEQWVLLSSVGFGGHIRPVVGAGQPVLPGNGVSTYMGHEGLSQDVSYDVYVKLGMDHMGRPEFSDAIAHFREQRNAATYKRQLEARGETVHVHKSTISAFSEAAKAEWFMDYEPKVPPAEPPGTSQSTAEPNHSPPVDGPESSDERRESWYRRWFGG